MVSQARAIFAGIFVVALIALLVVMASWLSGQRIEGDVYLVVSQTPVTGLLPHSRVLYRGLSAGQVESMQIDPGDASKILIGIRLKRQVPVTRSTYATLYLEGISGNRQILLQDTYRDRKRLGTRPRHPTRIPLRPPTLDVVAGIGERLVRSADRVSHQLERLLSDDNQRRIQGILDEMRRSLLGVTSLAEEMGGAASKLGEAGERIGLEVTEKTLQRANLALEQLTEAAQELQRVARALRENPQQMIGGPRPVQPGPGEQGHRRR
jgi:phospholipid/cholesterol/gamma-HCH transport system substrate-binding protein